jgi:hypothetical protein
MTSREQDLELFRQTSDALGVAISWALAGKFVPMWTDLKLESIEKQLLESKRTHRLVEFAPRMLRENEVGVNSEDEYVSLIACVMALFKELGREVPDGKLLLQEELDHLKPALKDPGLASFTLGVVFAPVGYDQVDVGGFVRPIGELRLETVVAMYKEASISSPSDHALLNLLDKLGL